MGSTNDPGGSTSFRRRITPILAAVTILVLCYYYRFSFSTRNAIVPYYSSHPSTSSGLMAYETEEMKHDIQVHNPNPKGSNVAVIIESRPLNNLAPLILHFATVLGPAWQVILFTPESTKLPLSAPFQRAVEEGQVQVRYLPPQIEFKVRDDVSEFLTSPWFWEVLAPAPHVLLFQADSIICANSPSRIEDFLEFDFIGAPINPNLGHNDEGMNGGLSLRNRTLTLDIIKRWSWKEERAQAKDPMFPNVAYEDQWFYKKMKEMKAEAVKNHDEDMETNDGENWEKWETVNLPTPEQAMKFSVETVWYDQPLGYHQVASWQWDRVKEIDAWCPEHRMATSDKMHNAGE